MYLAKIGKYWYLIQKQKDKKTEWFKTDAKGG